MLETTHVLTALALARNVNPSAGGPILAFGLGFVSHLVLDAIPHYDFQGKILKEKYYAGEKEESFGAPPDQYWCGGKKEFSKTGKIVIFSDIAVSFLIFIYLSIFGPLWPDFPNLKSLIFNLYSSQNLVFGVLGGIFPDVMSLIRFKTGFCRPRWFFEFHKKIQPPKINPVFGLAFQFILVLFCIYIFVK